MYTRESWCKASMSPEKIALIYFLTHMHSWLSLSLNIHIMFSLRSNSRIFEIQKIRLLLIRIFDLFVCVHKTTTNTVLDLNLHEIEIYLTLSRSEATMKTFKRLKHWENSLIAEDMDFLLFNNNYNKYFTDVKIYLQMFKEWTKLETQYQLNSLFKSLMHTIYVWRKRNAICESHYYLKGGKYEINLVRKTRFSLFLNLLIIRVCSFLKLFQAK